MRKNFFAIQILQLVTIIIPVVVTAQSSTEVDGRFEQIACDYFFNNIFKERYNEYKVIEFQSVPDSSTYYGIVHNCENWNKKTIREIIDGIPLTPTKVVAPSWIKTRRIRKSGGRLKVYVNSRIRAEGYYYVQIGTYRKLRFANYYYIKIDDNGNVIDSCETGQII